MNFLGLGSQLSMDVNVDESKKRKNIRLRQNLKTETSVKYQIYSQNDIISETLKLGWIRLRSGDIKESN